MRIRTDRNLRLLFASLLLWMLGVGLYEGLIPIFARQLGASAVELGVLFTVRSLALAVGFLIGWGVADRFSRRTLMLASWLIGLPVPLMLAAAPGYLWLLPGLLLYELTFFALPVIQSYVTERVPPGELAGAFSVMGTMTSVGFLVSPAVGGVIAEYAGIRVVLVVAFFLFVLSTGLIVRVEHGGPGAMPSGASRAPSIGDLRLLAPVLAVYVGVQTVILLVVPFLSPFLREARGVSLAEIGMLNSMMAVGAVILTPLAGRLADRVGLAPALAGQLGVFSLGVLATVYGPTVLLPVAATLRCRAPLSALAQAMIGARTPPAILGRAFSLAGMSSALLAAAGSFAGGYAYRANPAYPLLISSGAAVGLAILLLWRWADAPPPAS
ncbi:MAG: MFS transporter [Armatimonadota bacterium]|nr:MFS transporter [Armatimonadota bacterium]MDR7454984.1 MFS transporter [Armatimonadota bacterium]